MLLFSLLGLIVLGLSIYLGVLYSRLKDQEKRLAAEKARITKEVEEHKNSIVMISKATLQGQCDPAESCIRIYNLLNFIQLEDVYAVTAEYFKEVDELSVLGARKSLSARDAFDEDKIRFKSEDKFKESYFEELNKIIADLS